MNPIVRDLEKWIPHLLSVWRGANGSTRGPDDRLTSQELREVAAAVRTLSQGLTRERAMAGARYMDDRKLLGGYLLFYWPISYAQARCALRLLPDRPRDVLDLGSGPAPLAFAALDAGARGATIADRSEAALDLARQLAAEAGASLSVRSWNAANQPMPAGQWSLITAGHLFNELWAQKSDALQRRAGLVERIFERLAPAGRCLIIEPALRDTSRALLELRDELRSRGIVPAGPCLFRGACPALCKESDWCHQEEPWEPPRLVADIARAASIHKEALKMSVLLLARESEAPAALEDPALFRIVSEPLASKGRQRFMGCGPAGRVGLSLQVRHLTDANKTFMKLRRGDVVRIEGVELKGDGCALGPDSRVSFYNPLKPA